MAEVLKTTTANALLDGFWDTYFPSGSAWEGRTGAAAGPDNAAGGSLLVSITTGGFNAAASKSKTQVGTPSAAASGSGTLQHYRLKNAADTHRVEGTVTATGGGGDTTVDNTNVASTQVVKLNTFTKTSP